MVLNRSRVCACPHVFRPCLDRLDCVQSRYQSVLTRSRVCGSGRPFCRRGNVPQFETGSTANGSVLITPKEVLTQSVLNSKRGVWAV